jgi:hypothetical protein
MLGRVIFQDVLPNAEKVENILKGLALNSGMREGNPQFLCSFPFLSICYHSQLSFSHRSCLSFPGSFLKRPASLAIHAGNRKLAQNLPHLAKFVPYQICSSLAALDEMATRLTFFPRNEFRVNAYRDGCNVLAHRGFTRRLSR